MSTRITKHLGVGTMPYTAPECFLDQAITQAADIYSLGVVINQMVTRESPYKGLTMAQIMTAKLVSDSKVASGRRQLHAPYCMHMRVKLCFPIPKV